MFGNIKFATAAITAGVFLSGFGCAFAQAPQPDPGHPRVNEVERRIDNQQARVDRGVSDGRINARQAARDDAKLGREQTSLNRDMGEHRGHITRAEKRNLNRRLNHGGRVIRHQRVYGRR